MSARDPQRAQGMPLPVKANPYKVNQRTPEHNSLSE